MLLWPTQFLTELTIESKKEGEPSFIVTPFKGDKKERTEEAINTWLGR